MSEIIRFILEVENEDTGDFNLIEQNLLDRLNEMENILAKNSYSIYDARIEKEEV